MSAATVIVPQGVGDIVWVYQKLHPLFRDLRFRVVDLGGMPPSMIRRADKVVRALPGVSAVEYVRLAEYPDRLRQKIRIADVYAQLQSGAPTLYCVNPWLEAGTRLEAIDPECPVTWDLGVAPRRPEHFEGDPDTFVALYVSGDTTRHADMCETIWAADAWVDLVARVFAAHGLDPATVAVVLVGAAFDHPVTAYLWAALTKRGFGCASVYDLELAELLWVFGSAKMFLGYQSGLNVIADAAGATQTMVYFPSVHPMGDAWVRPAHRDGRFRWFSFNDPVAAIAAASRPRQST